MKPAPRRVLVYRLGSLGDTCVAIPALHVVRAAAPAAKITLLTNLPVNRKAAPAIALLEGTGLVDDYAAYPVGTRNPVLLAALAWRLRRARYDAVINLAAWRGASALRRDAFFFGLAGVRERIGFDAEVARELRQVGPDRWESEAARLVRRVRSLGEIDLADPAAWELHLSAEEMNAPVVVDARGRFPHGYLVASVGTKVPAKDWGQENWQDLMRQLAQDWPDLGCVFIGAGDERERSESCLRAWGGRGLNLCGSIPPRLSAALLAGARCFIGHDSGPMHLAAAVRTPCIAIFAARTPPGQWFPYGAQHEVLFRATSCAGCQLDVCVTEAKRCLTGITVEDVRRSVGAKLSTAKSACRE